MVDRATGAIATQRGIITHEELTIAARTALSTCAAARAAAGTGVRRGIRAIASIASIASTILPKADRAAAIVNTAAAAAAARLRRTANAARYTRTAVTGNGSTRGHVPRPAIAAATGACERWRRAAARIRTTGKGASAPGKVGGGDGRTTACRIPTRHASVVDGRPGRTASACDPSERACSARRTNGAAGHATHAYDDRITVTAGQSDPGHILRLSTTATATTRAACGAARATDPSPDGDCRRARLAHEGQDEGERQRLGHAPHGTGVTTMM